MSWRLGLGVAVIAAISIAAAVLALMSAPGLSGAQRIKAAIRWPTNCPGIEVARPSRDPIMGRWAPDTVQSADIACGSSGPHVSYAQFRDALSMTQALTAQSPSARYCLDGTSVVIDHLVAIDPTVFTEMCQTLSGSFTNTS